MRVPVRSSPSARAWARADRMKQDLAREMEMGNLGPSLEPARPALEVAILGESLHRLGNEGVASGFEQRDTRVCFSQPR